MKSLKILTAMLILSALISLPSMAKATVYTFTPNDPDVFDLDHYYLYIWGIKASIPAGEEIVSATISIKNINNWDANTNILKFFLLDNPKINDTTSSTMDIISISDGQSQAWNKEIPFYDDSNTDPTKRKFTDFLALTDASYIDSNGTSVVDQYSYSFTDQEIEKLILFLSSPNTFGKDSTFGFGFDPDCHFWNDGITFTITTQPVPEPGTMALLGAGLLGLGFFGRRRMNKS